MTDKLEITALSYGGRGLGRVSGAKVIFVPFTVPGDLITYKVLKEKKSFAEAEMLELLRPSDNRVEARCAYFGRCGGCVWQNIDYPTQLKWKDTILRDSLERIGGLTSAHNDPPLPAPGAYRYRSRARFQVGDGKWGFFAQGSSDIVDIESCPVLMQEVEGSFLEVKAFFRDKESIAQNITAVEVAIGGADKRIVLSIYLKAHCNIDPDELFATLKTVKGFEIFRATGKARAQSKKRLGDTDIQMKTCGYDLLAPSGSFTQINPAQNNILIEKVVEFAGLKEGDKAVDLFCGVGNLTFALARSGAQVVGVELDRRAVSFARQNQLKTADLKVRFFGTNAREWALVESAKKLAYPALDVLVLDPPRGGDLETTKAVCTLGPSRIVYVSCSPPTLARDISFLIKNGYTVERSVVIDMFAQTFHIESIVALTRD